MQPGIRSLGDEQLAVLDPLYWRLSAVHVHSPWTLLMHELTAPKVTLSTLMCVAGCVWSVTFLADGDLVTACADSTARVWSQQADRLAPEQERAALQSTVTAYQTASAFLPARRLP